MSAPLAEIVEQLARSGRFAFLHSEIDRTTFSWANLDRVLVQCPDGWSRLDRRMRRQMTLAVNSALTPLSRVLENQGRWGGLRVSLNRVHNDLLDGSTLMINDVHALLPNIGDIAHQASSRLHARVTVRAFASKSDAPGFRSHIDLTDTVVVQTEGRKAWTLWGPTRLRPVKDDIVRHPPPAASPLWEGVLSQGDVLYVPAGWWHRPVGLGGPSLHLSFDIHRPLRWEVIRTGKSIQRQQSPPCPTAISFADGTADALPEAGLVGWSEMFEVACLGREGSFFDDPLDHVFASPVRMFRSSPEGTALEVNSDGRFSRMDLVAGIDQGGMVHIEHAERFFERVAARVTEIAESRRTLATAALVGRGGPRGLSISGIANTDLILLQAAGCAKWEVTFSDEIRANTVLYPGDTISIPCDARYNSPPPQSPSLHVEFAAESAVEASTRRLCQALTDMGMANIPIPMSTTAHEPWLMRLRSSLKELRLST